MQLNAVWEAVRRSFQGRVSSLRLPNCCFWKAFLRCGDRISLLFVTPVGSHEVDIQIIRASVTQGLKDYLL